MKTRMKKLISISTIPMLSLALLLVLGIVLADDAAIGAEKPAPSLACTIDYEFVGIPIDGELFAWEGAIEGDIIGVIKWFFDLPMEPDTGKVTHYTGRWEIYVENSLILTGDSAGTTAKPPGKDGIWRGEGIVTGASPEFEAWIGRQSYEGGNVNWDSWSGEGIFRIN